MTPENNRVMYFAAVEKPKVCTAMLQSGTSFVKMLGAALARADSVDAVRIKQAFPEYWNQYLSMYESLEGRI